MKFWTRMLVTIAIMNVFLMIATPVLFPGETSPDELGGFFGFDPGQDLTQPGTGPGEQNYSQQLNTEGLSPVDVAISLVSLPNMLLDLVQSLVGFVNAPVAMMHNLHFPGIFVVLFGVAYYTALLLGLATLVPGRDA